MQHRTRAIWILLFLACGFTLISFNLIQIQLVSHEKYWRMAVANHTYSEAIPAVRGSFFDIDDKVLAQTQQVYDIRLDGDLIKKDHPEINLPKIAATLQVPVDAFTQSINFKNRDQLIAQEQGDAMATALRALKLNSLIITEKDRRIYPNADLAAHGLGFVDPDGHGTAGMEKEMDKLLSGVPGEREVERDAKKHDIAAYQLHETPAINGYNVTLTIKMGIQRVVEDALDQLQQTYRPHAAYIIVMDPQTGEIMGMGSRPTYDPNDRKTFTEENIKERCLTDPVEPGSIFKIITLAGALNEGAINLGTQIYCEHSSFYYGGKILKDDEEAGFGWLPVSEVMAQSSNIGFAKIAINYLGEQKLYNYARAFGIGQRTGLFTQQMESPGILHPLKDWSGISITRVPMGQEVSATPMQLVTAMSVIANGGSLMVPHLAKQISDENGHVLKVYQPKVVRQVISTDAARQVAEALHQVTVDGTAKNIIIRDPATTRWWSFAGKTGTAQKFIEGEGYSHTQHVASFVGFMPAEDPAFVALVMVDAPQTAPRQDYGAQVSAPVFASISRQIAQILNIPTDLPAPVPKTVLSANTPATL